MKKKKLFIIGWIAILVIVIFMLLFPIGTGIIRLGIVLGLIFLWISGICLFWRTIYLRVLLIIIALLVAAIILVPGHKANTKQLQDEYVHALLGYENVRYIWGGENKIGIDCSGLVREGFVGANLKVGIKNLNPKLIRRAFFIWWYDCSAAALGNSYKEMTTLVLKATSMEELDYSNIIPGDIIVAEKGFHTFAYIGNKTWLEANPDNRKTLKKSSEEKSKEWKDIPLRIVRWSELGE
ncbi:MAG: C40 family peptidase [Clostridiaceae bacterium]|nr:C40 family peptidase [Clostridiaceae bacterium]